MGCEIIPVALSVSLPSTDLQLKKAFLTSPIQPEQSGALIIQKRLAFVLGDPTGLDAKICSKK